MKSTENTNMIPPMTDSNARWVNILRSLNAWKATNGAAMPVTPRSRYRGLILDMKPASSITASPASVNSPTGERASRIEGIKAKRTIAGTHIINHQMKRPEYRHIHNDAMLIRTRHATNGDAVNVRINKRMASPIRAISHPDSPSL